MGYESHTVNSPSRIKRWSHHARFAKALALGEIKAADRIVDYGAGDGFLLQQAMRMGASGEIWAFEPIMLDQIKARLGDRATIIDNPDALPSDHFDTLFCMEVLEHLRTDIRHEALSHIRRILKPGGRAVITVPIEIGASSLFKNAVRVAMGKPHQGTNAGSVFWSAVAMPHRIARPETIPNYISGHLGFDYRVLPAMFREHRFEVESRSFSPAAALGPVLNSQVSYVLRKPESVAAT